MIFRSKPESLNRQAADWLARLHADDRSADDEADFHAWLRADPSHASAFEKASGICDGIGGLRGDPRPVMPQVQQGVSRRAILAGGAGLILTCGLGLGWQKAQAGVYETGIGEQRRFLERRRPTLPACLLADHMFAAVGLTITSLMSTPSGCSSA